MSLREFQILEKLGDGAYSQVNKVRRKNDNQEYALKKVKLLNLSEKEKMNALTEVRILASIDHPNIVSYKEAFFEDDSNSLCLIMEYADKGDLYDLIKIHQKKGAMIPEPKIWSIFIQTVMGLGSLHEQNIFHRDLKSANVFLFADGTSKLGDMNVSKVAKKGLLYTQTGTPYYASPEVWKDKPYDSKSDIWSLGCVLYEAVTLKPPFMADSMATLYKRVLKGNYPRIKSEYSKDLSNMIRWLLQVNANDRPTCQEILRHKSVHDHIGQLSILGSEGKSHKQDLMGTIQLPKNLKILSTRLPKSKYMKREEEVSNLLPDVRQQHHMKSLDQSNLRREWGEEERKMIVVRNSKDRSLPPPPRRSEEEARPLNIASKVASNMKIPYLYRQGQHQKYQKTPLRGGRAEELIQKGLGGIGGVGYNKNYGSEKSLLDQKRTPENVVNIVAPQASGRGEGEERGNLGIGIGIPVYKPKYKRGENMNTNVVNVNVNMNTKKGMNNVSADGIKMEKYGGVDKYAYDEPYEPALGGNSQGTQEANNPQGELSYMHSQNYKKHHNKYLNYLNPQGVPPGVPRNKSPSPSVGGANYSGPDTNIYNPPLRSPAGLKSPLQNVYANQNSYISSQRLAHYYNVNPVENGPHIVQVRAQDMPGKSPVKVQPAWWG